jgi:hypothetical protein
VDPEVLKHCRSWLDEQAAPHHFINLLYGIGFVGIRNKGTIEYRSQGSQSDVPSLDAQTHIVIHPCYADALNLQEIVVSSLDDTKLQLEGLVLDLPEFLTLDDYTTRLEALLSEIESIPLRKPGATRFEDFVGEVVRLCFFKMLNNVQAKQRDVSGCIVRDWIAANVAQYGFWEMLRSKYEATQIVWECKNYSDLHADDFHQAAYCTGRAIGNVCIVCFRGDPKEKHYYEHVRRIHDGNNHGLVLLLADSDLKVFLRQAKNGRVKEAHIQDRFDATVRLIS